MLATPINPLNLGPFHFPPSPLFNGLAFTVGLILMLAIRRRFKADPYHILAIFAIVLTVGIGFGARLFYFFGPWTWGMNISLSRRIITMFNYQVGGMVYIGGFVFAAVGIYLYMRYKSLDFWRYMDLASVALPLAQAIGRIGCLLNGCCYGLPTQSGFAILRYGVPVYPTQILLSLNGFLLFGVMLFLSRKKRKSGWLILVYLMLYSATRFMIEFLRDYPVHLFGLGPTQYILLGLFAFASFTFWKKFYRKDIVSTRKNPKV